MVMMPDRRLILHDGKLGKSRKGVNPNPTASRGYLPTQTSHRTGGRERGFRRLRRVPLTAGPN